MELKEYLEDLFGSEVPKILYHFVMDHNKYGITKDEAEIQDMADEYAVIRRDQAHAKIIVLYKVRGTWAANPSGSRFVIAELIDLITKSKFRLDMEEIRAQNYVEISCLAGSLILSPLDSKEECEDLYEHWMDNIFNDKQLNHELDGTKKANGRD